MLFSLCEILQLKQDSILINHNYKMRGGIMELLTVHKASQFLRVDKQHIYYLLRMYKIECLRVRRAIRIPKGELIDYAERKNQKYNSCRITGDSRHRRHDEVFALFPPDSISTNRGKTNKSFQRQQQGVELLKRRPLRIPRKRSNIDDRLSRSFFMPIFEYYIKK